MNEYIQLKPGSKLPNIERMSPFRSIVIIEEEVSPEWQNLVSSWLVKSGCLYMMAWGHNCNSWDDSLDQANLEKFNYEEIPEDKFVITTWHEKESLNDVFWFSKNNAFHPVIKIENTVILHISHVNKKSEFQTKLNNA